MLDIPKLIIRLNSQALFLLLLLLLLLILLPFLPFSWPCHAQNKLLTTEKVSFVKPLFSLDH